MFQKDGKKTGRRIAVGYDQCRKYAQISYCDLTEVEPETVSAVAGTEQYNIPAVLCKRAGVGQWYYGKEAESFAESFDENVVYCLKYARNRETAMNYTIEDKKLIREVFNALTKVRVTEETDQRTEDFQDILTFELPMGKSCTLVFEAGNLVVGDKVYKISDAEDLWALTTQIALENEPEGHHENQHGDRHHE